MALGSALYLSFASLLSLAGWTVAFDITRFDNVAVYWGQDSFGATNPSSPANFQQPVGFYCSDNAIDIIPIAFVNVFFGPGGLPEMNLANTCSSTGNATFPGSQLPNCASLASDIALCQSKGKIVTISIGGAGGGVGFQSDAQAMTFADQIWNLFLGGSSSTRPFGSAVLDGVDLDVEGGSVTGYGAFVTQMRTHFNGAAKKYYITAAPQCPFPDQVLGDALDTASFDAVFVQFYNNQCGLQNFNTVSDWDFGLWDNWARNTSLNKNVKIYIGAPASSTAAGAGFQDIGTLQSIAKQMRDSFPSFGGVMLWDASQAFANNRYDLAIKNSLVADGGTGFTFPPCSAPAYVSGTNYVGGSKVSFDGYIWEANFFASSTPSSVSGGSWSAISACSGSAASAPSTSTSQSSSTPSSSSSSPSTSSTSAPASGNCAGVAAWSNSVPYNGGSQVTSGGHLWTAKWWSEGDVPGGSAGDWTDDGLCTTAAVQVTKAPAAATGQAAPKSAVSSAKAAVSSAQANPTVSSAQANPTASSAQSKPTASSAQANPTASSAQAKPTASSVQAKPTVSSAQAKPTVSSAQAKPMASSATSHGSNGTSNTTTSTGSGKPPGSRRSRHFRF